METPRVQQYEYLTSQLRYHNEKIFQFFTLFLKLATTIVGGIFYLHWKLPIDDPKRASLALASDLFFILISLITIILIWNILRSWLDYRKTLSLQYPDIPYSPKFTDWISEAFMCGFIFIICIGFLYFNPLY